MLRRDTRRVRGFEYAILSGLLVVLILLLGLAVVLSHGPIQAHAVAEALERRVNERLHTVGTVQFGGGIVEWDSLYDGLVFRIQEPVFEFADGRNPVRASEVDFVFAPFNVFREGLRPYGVVLRRASFAVDVSGTRFDPAAAAAATEEPNRVARAVPDEIEVAQEPVVSVADQVPLPPRRPDVFKPAPAAAAPIVLTADRSADTAAPIIPADGLAIVRELEAATKGFASQLHGMIGEVRQLGLKRVELVEASLTVTRDDALPSLEFSDLNAQLLAASGQHIEVEASLAGNSGATPISFSIDLGEDGQPRHGAFRLSSLTLDDYFGDERLPIFVSTPMTLVGGLDFGDDAVLNSARFAFQLGSGAIGSKVHSDRRLDIGSAALSFVYDVINGEIAVDRLAIQSGQSHFAAAGRLTRWQGDPTGREMVLTLNSDEVVLDDGDGGPPVRFDSAEIEGIVDPGGRIATINRIAVTGPDMEAAMTARLGWGVRNQGISLSGAFSAMSAAELRDLWLPPISPGARNWFRENIKSGTIEPGTFDIWIVPAEQRHDGAPPVQTRLRAGFSDGRMTYARGFPPLAVTSGQLRLDSAVMETEFDNGEIALPSGRNLAIPAGKVAMSGLGFPDPDLTVTLASSGAVDAYIEYVDSSGLSGTQALTFGPNDVAGTASADLVLTMQASQDPADRNIQYSVDGQVDDFQSDDVVSGRSLSKGALDISVTRSDLAIKGDVSIDGAPSYVSYRQPLTAQSGVARSIEVAATLDAEGRAAFGIDLGDLVEGPTPVKVTTGAGDPDRASVDIDLTKARASIGALGWNKAPGRAGKLSFVAPLNGEVRRLDDFSLSGDGLDLRGWAEISASAGLTRAEFSTFRASKGDNARAFLQKGDGGRLAITVNATSLDTRRILAAALSQDPDPDAPGFTLSLKANRLAGHNGAVLTGVSMNLSQTRGRVGNLKLSAQIDGRWPMNGSGGGGNPVIINAADGGGLMRFLDFYRWADGGLLDFKATQRDSGAWDGTIKMTDFNVRGDPVIDRYYLRNAANARRGEERENGGTNGPFIDRAEFSKLRIDFSQAKGVFTMHDGVVKGPALGATFKGALNSRSRAVDVAGTFVPAYGLNNAISQVPVIGTILGGGRNEGLFGVTFRVGGTTKQPQVEVNALSAIAPGIFRKIFEYEPPS